MMHPIEVEGYPSFMASAGLTLLELCDEHNIPMESACGGFAACNSCRVKVLEGQLSPLLEEETAFLDRPDQRLGCQARVCGPLKIALDPGI